MILTNLWDIPAELISLIYLYRWKIEDIFKWIKCNLQCRHLLAESQQGVTIQIYLAIIASLLLFLAPGHRPTKREIELIQMFSIGLANIDELYSTRPRMTFCPLIENLEKIKTEVHSNYQ